MFYSFRYDYNGYRYMRFNCIGAFGVNHRLYRSADSEKVSWLQHFMLCRIWTFNLKYWRLPKSNETMLRSISWVPILILYFKIH